MPDTILPEVVAPSLLSPLLKDRPEIRFLDVRTSGEFASTHIPGAYNVPLDTLGEHTRELLRVADTPIILVCQSGGRARKAEGSLKAAGMDNLHILDGGMNGWIAGGFAVVRGAPRMSLERQVRIAAGSMAALGGILALLLNPLFAIIPAMVGSGLVFAGVTDTCAMGMLLARLSYNRPSTCDPAEFVRALQAGREAPTGNWTAPASAAACSS